MLVLSQIFFGIDVEFLSALATTEVVSFSGVFKPELGRGTVYIHSTNRILHQGCGFGQIIPHTAVVSLTSANEHKITTMLCF
jgi:hypothetical protein